jgi:hypothetical protein
MLADDYFLSLLVIYINLKLKIHKNMTVHDGCLILLF